MADPLFIAYNPDADPGERLPPEVVAEIEIVAPSSVEDDSLTTAKYKDESVTGAKLKPGAVGTVQLAEHGIEAINLGADCVTRDAIGDGEVLPAACGPGVVTAVDSSDNATETILKPLTAAEYALIVTPDTNTLYFISA